jgi:hypothetical protein
MSKSEIESLLLATREVIDYAHSQSDRLKAIEVYIQLSTLQEEKIKNGNLE